MYGPFAVGASPFRTKGNVYRALLEAFDVQVPGGASAVLSRLEGPEVKAFFEQQFLVGSMYDILPLLEASMMSARVANQGWREFVRGGGRFQAERDLNGIYKMMLKLATPRQVVERLPRMLIRYFDFGRVEGAASQRTRYEAAVHDIPKPVWPWLSAVAEGFIPFVMSNAGAKDATVIMHPPTPTGVRAGMGLLTGLFSVTWS